MAADARIRLCEQLKIKIGNLNQNLRCKIIESFKFKVGHGICDTSWPKKTDASDEKFEWN